MGMDITIATPVEIDTELARLYAAEFDARARAFSMEGYIKSEVARALGRGWNGTASEAEVEEFLEHTTLANSSLIRRQEELENLRDRIGQIRREAGPYQAEYLRRPWSRAFLVVTNGQGHVHSSMSCSTCYPTTRYHWMVEYSGKTQDEIVEAAGERACSICYPDAPVGATGTRMYSPDEIDAQARRVERERARAEREAAKITLTLWTTGHRYSQPVLTEVTWKTTRALQNDTGAFLRKVAGEYALVNGFDLDLDEWQDLAGGGLSRVMVNRKEARYNYEAMLAALAERGVDVETVKTRALKKVESRDRQRAMMRELGL